MTLEERIQIMLGRLLWENMVLLQQLETLKAEMPKTPPKQEEQPEK